MRSRLQSLLIGTALLIAAPLGAADAQRPTRGLTPVPFNENASVELGVTLDQKEPRIGSMVSICFQASKAGFATLWNISTANQVGRVFPNQFAAGGPAAPVDAGQRYCAGTGGDPFRFRVDGPAGTEDLYLLWTVRPELQPSGANYADAAALVQDMQRLGGANGTEWSATKITYDIVPAAGPAAPVIPPAQVSGNVAPTPTPAPAPQPPSGTTAAQTQAPAPPAADAPQVWILSLGANVDKLTKANQDATVFTKATMQLFNVPADHVRLFENGKNADFVAGMNWLTNQAQPKDFVFIYFSGHGGRFKSETSDDGWDEFLVPYDFETPNADVKNLLFSQRIAFLINRLQTKNVIAVIDACHSAGVFRSLEAGVLGARSRFYALTDVQATAAQQALADEMPRTRAAGGRNRIKANGLLLAAAHRDQNALESSIGGFFTVALVHEMVSKEGGSLDDVFKRTVALTGQLSKNRQEPEEVGDVELGRNITFDQ